MNHRLKSRSAAKVVITVLVVAAGAIAGGCGQSAKPGEAASLTISREFGQKLLFGPKSTPVTAGLTAMRQLQANIAVKTTYGGRYVNAIEGTAGSASSGSDWLFYVDGFQSDAGAAGWRVQTGEQIQWDFHQWRDITTPEAIVGAFPRPLSTRGVDLICKPSNLSACAAVRKRFPDKQGAPGAVTMVVGTWDRIAGVKGVPDLSQPAVSNGAFARISGKPGSREMQLLGTDGKIAATKGAATGLVAAARQGKTVTWVVTGTDEAGVDNAVSLFDANLLQNKFAVVATGHNSSLPLPIAMADAP